MFILNKRLFFVLFYFYIFEKIKNAMWSRKTKGEDLLLDFASLINKFMKERDDLIKGHGTLLAQIDDLKKENSHLKNENKMLRDDLFLLSKNTKASD